MKNIIMQYFEYFWLLLIALFGGLVGYCVKKAPNNTDKSFFYKVKDALLSVLSSLFVAVIAYLTASAFIAKDNLCIALAGLASFCGTDLLIALEKGFLNNIGKFIEKWIGKI